MNRRTLKISNEQNRRRVWSGRKGGGSLQGRGDSVMSPLPVSKKGGII